MIKQISTTVLISILVSLVVFAVFNTKTVDFSGFSRQSSMNVIPVDSTDGFSVGTTTNSALMTYIGGGTCPLVSDSSVAATSTGTATCATSGSQVGDIVVIAGLATTTTKIAAQWAIVGTIAGSESTTVRILNLTGTAAVPSATNGLGSSTPYSIFRVTSPSSSIFLR